MINIGLMSHSSVLGGAERMLYNCAMLLQEIESFHPIVFLPGNPTDELWTLCSNSDIEVKSISTSPHYLYMSYESNSNFYSLTLSSVNEIKETLIKNEVDIVICNTATSIAYVMSAFELQIPVITWIHGILDPYFISSTYDSGKRLLFDRLLIALSSKILFCSNWTKNYFIPYSITTWEVIPNWTIQPFKISSISATDNIFICLNRFELNKGIFTLLEAAKILHETTENFEIHFYSAGVPAIYKKVQLYIEDNNLENVVKIRNQVDNLSDVYNSCLCLIQPSYIESFGMTIIEAMSYKRPVIAAQSGGPEEIIQDGKTGFLVPKNNSDLLAKKMQYFLDNKEDAIKMGEASFQVYKDLYSPDRTKPIMEQLINKTLLEFKKTDSTKNLIHDLLNELMESNRISSANFAPNNECPVVANRPIDSNILCLSRIIENSITYYVRCERPTVSQIGVIFTSYQDIISNGTIELKVLYEKQELRNCTISSSDITNNCWTYFTFDRIYGCGNKVLKLKIIFHHNNSVKRFGLYENMQKRNLIYRFFNHFRISPKIENILYADLKE